MGFLKAIFFLNKIVRNVLELVYDFCFKLICRINQRDD